jgi:hypothetical protein
MHYEKRWENGYANGYASGYVSMDISPGTVRGSDRESQELWLKAASLISGKPIDVLRREMLLAGCASSAEARCDGVKSHDRPREGGGRSSCR